MKNEKQKQFILTNNLWKVILTLSWPAVLAMGLLGANNFLDGIFVGRIVGESALAGISVSMPFIMIIISLGVFIGNGAGTLLSIAIGANDKNIQRKVLGHVNSLTLLISIPVMILGLVFTKQILFLMGGRGLALNLGVEYTGTILWTTPIWIYTIAINNLIRAEGKMKTSALIMGIGLIINAIANYILMVVLGLGIKGAAIGTNIGMCVQTIIGIIYFSKQDKNSVKEIFLLRLEKPIVSKVISMGFAIFIMQIMNSAQIILILNILNHYGNSFDIAFYGIIIRIFAFMIQPLAGFMFALTPVIGINFGAGQIERVIKAFKYFIVTALVLILPFWILMLSFPNAVIGIMLENPQLTATNIFNFRVYMALLPVMPILFLSMGFFPSINKGKISSILGMLQQVVLYIPVMLILPIFLGTSGVYYGNFLIQFIASIPVFILIKREFRLLRTGVTRWQNSTQSEFSTTQNI